MKDEHECCCGHDHDHEHECCGGHHHEHEEGHECCCGGHHDEDHECCCGGHDHEHEHECCCGHNHPAEQNVNAMKAAGKKFNGFETDEENNPLDENADTSHYLAKAFEALRSSGAARDKKMFREMMDQALDAVHVTEESDRKILHNQVTYLLYLLSATECDLNSVTPVAADLPGHILMLAFNNLFVYHVQNGIDQEQDRRFEWHNVLYQLYFMAYRVSGNPEVGQFLLMQHFALGELLYQNGMWPGAKEALTSLLLLGSELMTDREADPEVLVVLAIAHFYLAVALANTKGKLEDIASHCSSTLELLGKAGRLEDPNLKEVIEHCKAVIDSHQNR